MWEAPLQRARTALVVNAPELVDRIMTPLGQGVDNTAFLVDGLVLRVSAVPSVVREARLLGVVAPRVSVPVPVPRFADADAGVLAYRLLPGRSLLGQAAPPSLGRRIGTFLRELHSIDPAAFGGAIRQEDLDPAKYMEDLQGPEDLVAVLSATVPPPADQRVVVHADLGAEHLLVVGSELTGVIDWSDAAVSDPALDFARLYRDFGHALLSSVLDAYGGLEDTDRTLRRVLFYARCAALEDLTYGLNSGRRAYARAAEVSINRLFGADADELLGG